MENKTLKEFAELTFSNAPVPGGGGVCGNVGALAASLAGMVTSLTTGKKKYAEFEDEIQSIMDKANTLKNDLLNSINEDAEAFKPLAKAYGMDKNDPNYEQTLESCLKIAASSPMNILQMTCKVIELDLRLKDIGSKLAISDAATSVMLAYGVLYGCYVNIIVNTRLMKDITYANNLNKQAKALLDEYTLKATNCYETILERLNG